jgi:transposase-like protein
LVLTTRCKSITPGIKIQVKPIYFSDLSIRKVSQQHSSPFIKRNHVFIWNCIQHYKPEKLFHRKRRIYEFIINETPIKVGTELLVGYRYGLKLN